MISCEKLREDKASIMWRFTIAEEGKKFPCTNDVVGTWFTVRSDIDLTIGRQSDTVLDIELPHGVTERDRASFAYSMGRRLLDG